MTSIVEFFTSGRTYKNKTSTEIYSFVTEWERHFQKGCIPLILCLRVVTTSEKERPLIEVRAGTRMILVTKLFKDLNYIFLKRAKDKLENCSRLQNFFVETLLLL